MQSEATYVIININKQQINLKMNGVITMGSFSRCKIDTRTELRHGTKFKFLVPEAFGGGQLIATYEDYGNFTVKGETYDWFELLANFNMPQFKRGMTPVSDRTDVVRNHGIDLGCYDGVHRRLKYPLRIVSVKTMGTYEDFDGLFSPDASDQGMGHKGRYNKAMFEI